MKKVWLLGLCSLLTSLILVPAAFAQSTLLTLSLSRDFGYGGFNGDIQGLFSMHVTGPASLTRVDFFLDSTQIGESSQAPFDFQFSTDVYPLGAHALYAIGYTADGQVLRSETISAKFVPASEGTKAAVWIVIPLLVILVGAVLLAIVLPGLLGRKQAGLEPGAPRAYTLGGAICPKCQRPFGLHLYGMNLAVGKLDRCPYCGRWSFVRRAGLNELHSAEQAELERSKGQVVEVSGDEKLKKDLDDSKYQAM
jgi:hypothetical protein